MPRTSSSRWARPTASSTRQSSAVSSRSWRSTARRRRRLRSTASGSTGRSCSSGSPSRASWCEDAMTEIRKPPRLRPGDTVGIVAPATGWANRSELLRGVAGLEAWGLTVRLGDHINDRHGYMAGRDEDRAADLHAMLADPEIRAIVCLQGGYGMPRLIPLLDEKLFAANPKAICGYSDLTTLHLAAGRWGNVISFYSNGASGIGSPEVSEFSKKSLQRALFSDEPYGPIGPNPDDPYVRAIVGGRATGRLAGGCAGLLSSSIGTRLQPDLRGRIVVLEEIEMEGYVLDGILTHLR